VRGYEILHRAVGLLNEGGRYAVRACRDRDRRGAHLHATGIRDVHPTVDIHQSYALAVDRNLDLLRRIRRRVERRTAVSNRGASRLMMEGEAEGVLTVRREVVHF
jgi:hypothetical protein